MHKIPYDKRKGFYTPRYSDRLTKAQEEANEQLVREHEAKQKEQPPCQPK